MARQSSSPSPSKHFDLELLEKRDLLSGTPYRFDFGTASSPVALDTTRTPLAAFATTPGYGWESVTGLTAIDRGTSDSVTRDFVTGTSGKYLVNLPSGTYDLTLTMGDATTARDGVSVSAEGVQLAGNLSSAAGEFLRLTYRVPVTDGQLSLQITDNGGSTSGFALNRLDVIDANPTPFPNNSNPPTLPAPTGPIVNVSTLSQLQSAVSGLKTGQTIVLAPGTYTLAGPLYLPQGISNVAIRGQSGDADDVVIRGNGMSGSVQFGFWVRNVQNVTFANLTVRDIKEHAFILNEQVESPVIHNVRMVDAGDQFIKANPDGSGGGVDNGVVQYCTMEYTTVAPDTYTNGVDVHGGDGWVIRNNVFRNIRTTSGLAGPAVLMWNSSRNTITEGNTFINNHRDIAYGLVDQSGRTDHSGGIIRGNFISRTAGTGGDVAIGVADSPNTQVLHNTVKLNGVYPNAVEYRFASTTGLQIRNNLTDAAIVSRDGAQATVSGNVTNAQSSWFRNAAAGDLHVLPTATAVVDRATAVTGSGGDYDGQGRAYNSAPDVGADEYHPVTAAPGDTTAPTVTITAPAAGATVSGTVTVSANASDNVGVAGVKFYVNGQQVGAEDTAAPYSVSWTTTTAANGNYTLTAVARDAAGNSTTSAARTVTVSNTTPDTTPPTVAITAPAAGSDVTGTVTVTASASDNVGVVGVRFYLDGQPLGAEDTTAPYSVSWDTAALANGDYTLTAVARDAAGNSRTSVAASVSVSHPPDTIAPTVALTAPAAGATVSGTVAVSANASDNVGVVGVQFYLNGQKLGAEDTTSPYSVNWNTTTATDGNYTLTAVARDAYGNRTTSAARTVAVQNGVVAPAGLVAAYNFNEGSGTALTNRSGSGLAGTISGATWSTSGKYGGALSFDGTNDLVTIADANALDLTNGMTLEAWVRPTSSSGWRTAILKETSGGLAYGLYTSSDTGRPAGYANIGGSDRSADGTASLPVNAWTHVATTYDGATLRLFVNGAQVSSRAISGNMAVSTGALRIGGNSVWGEYFAGLIDDVRIYNRALTAAQIQADMNSAVGTPPAGDTAAPTVVLTGPGNGTTVSGTVTVSANASDNVGVAGVKFYVNGQQVGAEDTAAPYSVSWTTTTAANGSHTLTAVARDAAGNSTTSAAFTVTVSNITSDTTPPTVTSTSPASGGTGVATGSNVTVTFSEAMTASTVSATTLLVRNAAGQAVTAAVTYDAATRRATIDPSASLANSTTYTVVVKGGSGGVKDLAGNALAADYTFTFTTTAPAAAPVANAGADRAANEGSSVSFTGSATGGEGALTYAWNFGDGGSATGQTATRTYADNGTYTVTLTVTDSLNRSSSDTLVLTVANVAPTGTLTDDNPVQPGATVTISFGNQQDPSAADRAAGYRYSYDFNNDGTFDTVNVTTPSVTHVFTQVGNFTVRGRIIDKDSGWTDYTTVVEVADPASTGSLPLIDSTNLQYVGAFRLPGGTIGTSTFEFGGTGIAFNPANNSLFIVGHDQQQHIAEVKIPTTLVNSSQIRNLATATVLQPFVDVLARIPNDYSNVPNGVKVGGLQVVNGQLIGTEYAFYDTNNLPLSHFTLSSTNLSTAQVSGLYKVGNQGAGLVAGYMAPVPSEWQSALGAPYLTGQSAIAIVSRTSSGPAAFGFDPAKLGSTTAPATPYVYYPIDHVLGPTTGPANPIFNGTTTIQGVFFAPGTRSVVFLGSTGMNAVGYGGPQEFNDPYRMDKTYHTQNGDYRYYAWAYDANDLVAVKNGLKQPWDVRPYKTWSFDVPQFEGRKFLGGAAFDAATGRLYVSQTKVDYVSGSSMPLIQVYQLVVPKSFVQTTAADFAAGTQSGTQVTNTSGGEVRLATGATSGTFTSSVIDAGKSTQWNTMAWDANIPTGTTVKVQTSTSTDGATWSGWQDVTNVVTNAGTSTATVASPAGRYLRYRVILTAPDTTLTPTLTSFTIWGLQ